MERKREEEQQKTNREKERTIKRLLRNVDGTGMKGFGGVFGTNRTELEMSNEVRTHT